MSPTGGRTRRPAVAIFALVAFLAAVPASWNSSQAEEMIDLTLMFHSAVQGKIAPCG